MRHNVASRAGDLEHKTGLKPVLKKVVARLYSRRLRTTPGYIGSVRVALVMLFGASLKFWPGA